MTTTCDAKASIVHLPRTKSASSTHGNGFRESLVGEFRSGDRCKKLAGAGGAAVEAEGELVEVVREVVVAGAVVKRALEPAFQQ